MTRSVASRVDKIEPKVHTAWRRAWSAFARDLEKALPDEILEAALRAPDDEGALNAFLDKHGLAQLDDWSSEHTDLLFPVSLDGPADLTLWPSDLPEPPPEPDGILGRMRELRRSEGDDAAFAACALLVIAQARTVRNARARSGRANGA